MAELRASGECDERKVADGDDLLEALLTGAFSRFVFTPLLVDVVTSECDDVGFPHLCGDESYIKVKAGKKDDPANYLAACRAQERGVLLRHGRLTLRGQTRSAF